MSDKIRLLPDIVANQIAAGEVVNRPSSVVKEMMENAIDAGADSVSVNFRDGGKELIQIVDNGSGMSPIDARMAFERHATSKISAVDDIYSLHTFGFRGEALASIAAVSQIELRTRQVNDEVGTVTMVNGGEFSSQTPTMCPVGSQFYVRNLFYNVPARRRFLDKSTTSASQIKTEFQRVALCNPQVVFELFSNDAPIYNLPATSLAGRIVDVVGKHMKQNLLEVSADTSIVTIEGFVGRPSAAKKSNPEQYLFVNGRYFRSPYFNKAILKAYEKLIPDTCFPSYFIYLSIEPERIDVNVHPQKTEVKFADTEAVWQIINAAIRETLAKTGAVPMLDFDDETSIDIPVLTKGALYSEPLAMSRMDYNPFDMDRIDVGPLSDVDFSGVDAPYYIASLSDDGTNRPHAGVSQEMDYGVEDFDFVPSSEVAAQQRLLEDEVSTFSFVTVVGNGYVSALYGGRFVVADLRRVKERILYDNYMLMLGNGSAVCEQLLFPEKLIFSNDEYALLEENAVEFAALGFDIDFKGDCTIEVGGTPAEMSAESIDELIFDLLQAFAAHKTVGEVKRETIAGIMSRNGARSLPRNISPEDAAQLLERLCEGGNVSFTPSGKAIMAEMTVDDIRSKLK